MRRIEASQDPNIRENEAHRDLSASLVMDHEAHRGLSASLVMDHEAQRGLPASLRLFPFHCWSVPSLPYILFFSRFTVGQFLASLSSFPFHCCQFLASRPSSLSPFHCWSMPSSFPPVSLLG